MARSTDITYTPAVSGGHSSAVPRSVHHHLAFTGDKSKVGLVVVHTEGPFGEPLQFFWTAYDTNGEKAARSRKGWIDAADAFADARKKFPQAVVR